MYKNYSYSNMPVPVKKATTDPKKTVKQEVTEQEKPKPKKKSENIFDNLETDDLILLIVIFILITEECDDKFLLGAIAYIFLSDRL